MKTRLLVSFAFIILAALVVVDAFAQDDTSAPPQSEKAVPAAPAAPQKFYLEVDAADLDVISKALAEMPFKLANPLLLKLSGQLRSQEQIQAAADKSLAETTEKAKKRK